MNRTIDRLKLIFLGVFVIAAAGVWAYQMLIVKPRRECEAQGAWWGGDWRECGRAVSIAPYEGPPPPPIEDLGKSRAAGPEAARPVSG